MITKRNVISRAVISVRSIHTVELLLQGVVGELKLHLPEADFSMPITIVVKYMEAAAMVTGKRPASTSSSLASFATWAAITCACSSAQSYGRNL